MTVLCNDFAPKRNAKTSSVCDKKMNFRMGGKYNQVLTPVTSFYYSKSVMDGRGHIKVNVLMLNLRSNYFHFFVANARNIRIFLGTESFT